MCLLLLYTEWITFSHLFWVCFNNFFRIKVAIKDVKGGKALEKVSLSSVRLQGHMKIQNITQDWKPWYVLFATEEDGLAASEGNQYYYTLCLKEQKSFAFSLSDNTVLFAERLPFAPVSLVFPLLVSPESLHGKTTLKKATPFSFRAWRMALLHLQAILRAQSCPSFPLRSSCANGAYTASCIRGDQSWKALSGLHYSCISCWKVG